MPPILVVLMPLSFIGGVAVAAEASDSWSSATSYIVNSGIVGAIFVVFVIMLIRGDIRFRAGFEGEVSVLRERVQLLETVNRELVSAIKDEAAPALAAGAAAAVRQADALTAMAEKVDANTTAMAALRLEFVRQGGTL